MSGVSSDAMRGSPPSSASPASPGKKRACLDLPDGCCIVHRTVESKVAKRMKMYKEYFPEQLSQIFDHQHHQAKKKMGRKLVLKFLEAYTRISCGEFGDFVDDVSIDDLFSFCFRKKQLFASKERGCDDDDDDMEDEDIVDNDEDDDMEDDNDNDGGDKEEEIEEVVAPDIDSSLYYFRW